MMCPQCNAELGDGAKACASCGWAASKKKVWIILGIIFGVLFLACCGIGSWFSWQAKTAFEKVMPDLASIQALMLRAQVANYAQVRGKPPATLEEATAEPLKASSGENVRVEVQSDGKSVDMWKTPFRLTMGTDRSFEIRSAGMDRQMDTADDIVEKGTLDDDVKALLKEVRFRSQEMGEKMSREMLTTFGVDPDKLNQKRPEPREPEEEAPEAPEPKEGPEEPKPTEGEGGGK